MMNMKESLTHKDNVTFTCTLALIGMLSCVFWVLLLIGYRQ